MDSNREFRIVHYYHTFFDHWAKRLEEKRSLFGIVWWSTFIDDELDWKSKRKWRKSFNVVGEINPERSYKKNG